MFALAACSEEFTVAPGTGAAAVTGSGAGGAGGAGGSGNVNAVGHRRSAVRALVLQPVVLIIDACTARPTARD